MRNIRVRPHLVKGAICWLLFGYIAFGQNAAPPTPLRVGIKDAPPFAMKDDDGEWQGIAVDLWRLVAHDLEVDYSLVESNLPELLKGVEEGGLDIGIGAITVSADREHVLDFSHSFDNSGIGVAAKIGDHRFVRLFRSILSIDFLKAVAALCFVLALAGGVVWYLERKRNAEQFGGSPLAGFGTGFWWAAVTMTTVGYGDKSPTTLAGRAVGLVWMFIGVITISGFTAAIASTLTASNLETNLNGPSDLNRVKIGAISGTFGADVLQSRGLKFIPYPSYQSALEDLAAGKLGAVVHDQPLLIHQVNGDHLQEVDVVHWLLAQQSYAFALPTGSTLREPLNRSILKAMSSPEWSEIRRRYLGVRHAN